VVLDGAGDNVLSPVPVGLGDTAQGHIVRFAARGRKDNLVGADAQYVGHGFPGPVHGVGRFLRKQVQARRVSVKFRQVGGHDAENFVVQFCCGVIVQIYSHMQHFLMV